MQFIVRLRVFAVQQKYRHSDKSYPFRTTFVVLIIVNTFITNNIIIANGKPTSRPSIKKGTATHQHHCTPPRHLRINLAMSRIVTAKTLQASAISIQCFGRKHCMLQQKTSYDFGKGTARRHHGTATRTRDKERKRRNGPCPHLRHGDTPRPASCANSNKITGKIRQKGGVQFRH